MAWYGGSARNYATVSAPPYITKPAHLRRAIILVLHYVSTKPCSPDGLHIHEADSCIVAVCVGNADGNIECQKFPNGNFYLNTAFANSLRRKTRSMEAKKPTV